MRGGGVVEPDERLAVDELMQRWEIATHAFDVKFRVYNILYSERLGCSRKCYSPVLCDA